MELTQEQAEEYQSLKLNGKRDKEDAIFYKGLNRTIIRNFLKSIPQGILIDELKDLKLIKRNWEIKKL